MRFSYINPNRIFLIILSFFIYFNINADVKNPVTLKAGKSETKLITDEKGNKVYLTILTENPVIRYDDSELRTEKIVKQGEVIKATGKVRLIDNKNNFRMNADEAVFYEEKKYVELTGNPRAVFKRESDNSDINLRADKIIYDIDSRTFVADDNVKLTNNDAVLLSGKAVYRREDRAAIFSENPVIQKDGERYTADEIQYYTDEKLVVLNKNVRIQAFFEEKNQATGVFQKMPINAEGDRYVLQGEGKTEIWTGENVHIIYQSENIEAFGNRFKSARFEKHTLLWGNTYIVFKDEKTSAETSRAYGDLLEYYEDSDDVFLNGNVKIVKDDGNISGDMAKFNRQNSRMTVTGNAMIEKDDSNVFAQSIIINTKTNETLLHGDIKGKIID